MPSLFSEVSRFIQYLNLNPSVIEIHSKLLMDFLVPFKISRMRIFSLENNGNLNKFVAVVSVPDVNSRNSSQANLSVPYSVKSATTVVTNADVLKSIVSLIASINKQIQALRKLILARR
jgi:hypothetical protein